MNRILFHSPVLKKFSVAFLPALLIAIIVFLTFPVIAAGQGRALSLVDVITVLKSKKAGAAEKNKLLADGVRQRGVTFVLTEDLEKELRAAGAKDALIAAIREKSAPVKTEIPTPAQPSENNSGDELLMLTNSANEKFVMADYAAAADEYSRAIAISPADSTLFFKRGSAYERLGNKESAAADYQKAIELDSSNEAAAAAISRLEQPATNLETPRQRVIVVQNRPATDSDAPSTSGIDPNNVGPLNRYAVKLANPVYPAAERARKTEGTVTVAVTIDEYGKVLSVKATSGPKALRQAAEDAVRKSTFKPVMIDNKSVRASGHISFNFKA